MPIVILAPKDAALMRATPVEEKASAQELQAEPSPPLLELRDVTKSFSNGIHILGPVRLTVVEGEFVVPPGMTENAVRKSVLDYFAMTFEEDNSAVKKYR